MLPNKQHKGKRYKATCNDRLKAKQQRFALRYLYIFRNKIPASTSVYRILMYILDFDVVFFSSAQQVVSPQFCNQYANEHRMRL